MKALLPFIRLYKKHWFYLSLGSLLGLITLLFSISLLTVSGWFITAAAVAGLTLAKETFNYMLPGAAVRGLAMGRTAGRWGERVVSHDATFKLLTHLRVYFFQALIPLLPKRQHGLRDADLLNRIVADVAAMDHVYLRLLSPIITSFIGILFISGVVYIFSPVAGIYLISLLLLTLIIWPPLFYLLGKSNGQRTTLTTANFRIQLLDWINAYAELLIYGGEQTNKEQLLASQTQLIQLQAVNAKITALASTLLQLVNGIILVGILWIAIDGLNGQAPDPFSALIVFAALASVELLLPIAGAFQYLGQTLTSAKRLNQITQATPEVSFAQQAVPISTTPSISIQNVSFGYDETPVIKQLSLTVDAGSKVAILGKTGCGKSTLAQLLTRIWDVDSGHIRLDNNDITLLSEPQLRSIFSVVSQRVDILNDTLAANLRLASPNASDDELKAVLMDVGLKSLLQDQGLGQWLGDGGRVLSGGEKRRISIARAILHNAPILLLDEPTEGLDKTTEQEILALLMAHAAHKTLIFITHRLSHLDEMDKIVILEQGEICEQGSFDELIKTESRLKSIFVPITVNNTYHK